MGQESRTGTDIIAGFDLRRRVWSRVGKLSRGRTIHSVIYDGSRFLVVGGTTQFYVTDQKTEICHLEGTTLKCEGKFRKSRENCL